MAWKLSIEPMGAQLAVEAEETLLAAAARQHIVLPHACQEGVCGACKCHATAGSVAHGKSSPQVLSEQERAAGWLLTCQASPLSDVTIDCPAATDGALPPEKTFRTRVEKLTLLAHDVMEMVLRLPAAEAFAFLPGQYIDILTADGGKKSFSIACAPESIAERHELVLHLRLVPNGVFTNHVFHTMQVKEMLRVSGPHGTFYLRHSSAPAVLLAGGTGFAPVKAMVESQLAQGSQRELFIYVGAKTAEELYGMTLAQSWQQNYPHIHFVPVLSEPTAAEAWSGRTGFVHHALCADWNSLPQADQVAVYACGSPAMIAAAQRDLSALGVGSERFFSDAFVPSAAPAAP